MEGLKYADITHKIIGAAMEVHLAQGLNYLEAYNMETGMLINFGAKSLQYKRLLNKKYTTGNQ